MEFEVTYADAADRRPVRIDTISADDIDAAARQAVETCPGDWYVVRVEQAGLELAAKVARLAAEYGNPTADDAAMDAIFRALPDAGTTTTRTVLRPHTSTFQRYIEQGQDAVLSHPDYDQLEPWTTAKDTIASILHWVEEVWNETSDGGPFNPTALLDSAHVGYIGDFEDDARTVR